MMIQPRTKNLIGVAAKTSGAETDFSAVTKTVKGLLRTDLRNNIFWTFKKETALPSSRPQNCPVSEWVAAAGHKVWEITETETPGDPCVPARCTAMFDASNSCSAVCQLMCICYHMRPLPLILQLGGQLLTIDKMHMVNGTYRTKKKVFNPLLMGMTRVHTLMEDAAEYQDGMHGYKHTWLEATVIDSNGAVKHVGIDPTAAQFGHATEVLIFTQGAPEGGSYIREKECTNYTLRDLADLLNYGLHAMMPGTSLSAV